MHIIVCIHIYIYKYDMLFINYAEILYGTPTAAPAVVVVVVGLNDSNGARVRSDVKSSKFVLGKISKRIPKRKAVRARFSSG